MNVLTRQQVPNLSQQRMRIVMILSALTLWKLLPVTDALVSISFLSGSDFPISLVVRGLIFFLSLLFVATKGFSSALHIVWLGLFFSMTVMTVELTTPGSVSLSSETTAYLKGVFGVVWAGALVDAMEHKTFTSLHLARIVYFVQVGYCTIFGLTVLTGRGLQTYGAGGESGLWRAANDYTLMLLILLPLSMYYLSRKRKPRWLIHAGVFSLPFLLVGTRSGVIGLVFLAMLLWRYSRKQRIRLLLFLLPVLIILLEILNDNWNSIIRSWFWLYSTSGFWGFLFRGRQVVFQHLQTIWNNMTVSQSLFGLGQNEFARRYGELSFDYWMKNSKIAEMDLIDLFFWYGIIGFVTIVGAYLAFTYRSLKNGKPLPGMRIALAAFWVHGIIAGHAFTTPIVGGAFGLLVGVATHISEETYNKET
jgi:hypothetical protein